MCARMYVFVILISGMTKFRCLIIILSWNVSALDSHSVYFVHPHPLPHSWFMAFCCVFVMNVCIFVYMRIECCALNCVELNSFTQTIEILTQITIIIPWGELFQFRFWLCGGTRSFTSKWLRRGFASPADFWILAIKGRCWMVWQHCRRQPVPKSDEWTY